MNDHDTTRNIHQQKGIDQTQDRNSKVDEKSRKETDSQRERYQETDG